MATDMVSPGEDSPVSRKAAGPPEVTSAGHFEHVAHMNMFEAESPAFRIPVKLCFMDLLALSHGLADAESSRSDPEVTVPAKRDNCSKILDFIKHDLRLRESEESSDVDSEGHGGSRDLVLMPSKERRKKRKQGNRKKGESAGSRKNGEDQAWDTAKQKVEEFLDFPAVISGLVLREKPFRGFPESGARPGGTKPSAGGECASANDSVSIPNTRHNAIFLRDSVKNLHSVNVIPQRVDTEGLQSDRTQVTDQHFENGKPIVSRTGEGPLPTGV